MSEIIVKRLLHILLLVGAVTGLVGQGTAIASARPCPEMIEVQAAKDEACAMMATPKDHGTPGAQHVPSGCMAMVGCIAPATIEPTLFIAPSPSIEPLAIVWPAPRSLNNRSIAPAQEPPATLL